MRFKTLTLLIALAVLATAAQAVDLTGKAPAGSVVYVEKIPGKTFPAPTQPYKMDQRQMAFVPHVLVVPVGATVDFINSDNVQHNVWWPSISGNRRLTNNLGTWPQGDKRSFTFNNPGVVTLLCNTHSEMSGYIVVTPTPYFATADASGNYRIPNVPDGSYTVTVWHEGTKPISKPVAISGNTKLDF